MFSPLSTCRNLLTIATQTVIMKQELKVSIVFSSMTVFDLLRDQLFMAFFMVNNVIAGKVSLDRVNDFLKNVCDLMFHFHSLRIVIYILDRTS